MKKIIPVCIALLMLVCFPLSVFAAGTDGGSANSPISVEIVSPSAINSTPVHDDIIEVKVTNNDTIAHENLCCYLVIVDVDRNHTYPVDEFGEEAYQTKNTGKLLPGESATITIPVRIMYVGNFRFTVSATDIATDCVYTSNALHVNITTSSNMNNNLVMAVSVVVPVALFAAALVLSIKKKKNKPA